jgi:hypothetical protein
MAEENLDPKAEGRRIAHNYLSQLGWAREWRRTVTREIRPAWNREEMETKFRRADEMEESAEADISREFDRLRSNLTPGTKETLAIILKELGGRNDLGFIGKRIVVRIRKILREY